MARHFKQQKQVVHSKAAAAPKQEKEVLEAEGRITETLPNAEFMVQLLDEQFTGYQLKAKISGRMRMNNIKILLGDYVRVELNPYDLARGRIIFRHRGKPGEVFEPRPKS